jgi:subtilisin family serine protease
MYVNGKYIRIAILDSGIDPTHASMSKTVIGDDKIQYSHDFSGSGSTEDSYGHGTHVATVAAGTAAVSTGAYQGVAYDARLVNLKVLGADGKGKSSGLLNAIDWIAANYFSYKIKVVNLSLGTVAVESYKNDPLCKAVRKLVDLGIVVVAAAGNEGKDANGKKVYGQIHSPGTDPSVITVGASNSMGTASRSDDGVASFSSRGPTRSYWTDSTGVKHYDNIIKPDLVAPGNRIIGARARLNHLVRNFPSIAVNNSSNDTQKMMYMSGTSVAAPAVTGAVALVLNANPNLTPALVKAILMYTAQPLKGFNMFEQGAGQLNVDGAVKLANTVRSDLKGKPAANLVTNPGFESGSLSPWSKDYGSPTVQSTNVKSGSKALKLPYATSIYRTITGLKPNTYYTFTGWFKQTAGDIRVYIENFGGEEYNQAFDNKEYRHLRFEFKTGATNTSVKIVITKAKAGSTSAVGYVDDLELAETSTFPSLPLGNTLLLGTMPAASTTISNFKFAWAQGILLNHAYAIGAELFSKYQSAYDQGGLLGDGQTVSGTSITRNSLKLTTGVTVGNQILTSNGTTLNAGTILVSSGVLLGDGTLLGDGVLLGDGTLLGDGVMLGDGCLLGDTTMSNAVLTQGDGCPCMTP